MSDWTCEQVNPLIDLVAAGESDEPMCAAVGRHLKACAACRESHRQARQLLGLLDQRFQESERLERLWSRLEAERRPGRRPTRPILWRAAAMAAMVLLTLGLSGWLGPGRPNTSEALQLTAVWGPPAVPGLPQAMARNDVPSKMVEAAPGAMTESAAPEYPLNLHGKTPAEFRRELRAAAGTERLPPPPAVDLTLEVRNTGQEALPLRFGDDRTELTLDLQGPGVVDVQAPDGAPPPAALGVVRGAAGDAYRVAISRLAYGTQGAVRYLYWTEPGEYTLTITLRVRVETDSLTGAREIVTSTGPLKVRVVAEH